MGGAAVIVLRVPDLERTDQQRAAAAQVTTRGILKEYWRTFLTLGLGVVLLQAIRQTRQVVIPLWAAHIGLSPTANSLIYGTAGLVDVSTFYPAGKVMDLLRAALGRGAVHAGPRSLVRADDGDSQRAHADAGRRC